MLFLWSKKGKQNFKQEGKKIRKQHLQARTTEIISPRRTAGQRIEREAVQKGAGDKGIQEKSKNNWSLGKLRMGGLKELLDTPENPRSLKKVNTLLGFEVHNILAWKD